jgi:hypothetical protein
MQIAAIVFCSSQKPVILPKYYSGNYQTMGRNPQVRTTLAVTQSA